MPYTHRGTSTTMQLMAAPSPSPSLCMMQRQRPATCTSPFSAHCVTNVTRFKYSGAGIHTRKKQRKPGHLHVTHASDGAAKPPPSSSVPSSPWGIGDRELRTLQRAARLHLAITNRSARELLELVGDECQYYCGSSFAQLNPILLTKQVVERLQSMARNNVSFIINPHENGVDIGIRLVLVTRDKILPLGFGCSISTNHTYDGSVLVTNMRGINSLLQLGTLTQKLDDKILFVIDKLLPKGIPEDKRNACKHCFLSLLFMSIFLVLFNTFV